MSIKTVIGPGRFSYPAIFKPSEFNGNYGMEFLIDKKDVDTIEAIKKAIEEAKIEGESKLKGAKNIRLPLMDGDGKKPQGGDFGPECKGHYVLRTSAKADIPPKVYIGKDKRKAYEGDVNPGDYGYIGVAFGAYNFNGKKPGITASLTSVLKTKDGEPFGGEAFDNFNTDEIDFDIEEVDPLAGLLD